MIQHPPTTKLHGNIEDRQQPKNAVQHAHGHPSRIPIQNPQERKSETSKNMNVNEWEDRIAFLILRKLDPSSASTKKVFNTSIPRTRATLPNTRSYENDRKEGESLQTRKNIRKIHKTNQLPHKNKAVKFMQRFSQMRKNFNVAERQA